VGFPRNRWIDKRRLALGDDRGEKLVEGPRIRLVTIGSARRARTRSMVTRR
jgi:hypothetical protein